MSGKQKCSVPSFSAFIDFILLSINVDRDALETDKNSRKAGSTSEFGSPKETGVSPSSGFSPKDSPLLDDIIIDTIF
ncbi:MAG: hypothetical protein OEZ43_02570 [Gammaproteobacteria bacterium]|nr:hypothetical protein [Gammaproteobacteria bacterium]